MTESARKPLTKTAFIRSLPTDVPARDVVEKAKAVGLTITESYVYEIRSTSKHRGAAKKSGTPAKGVKATASKKSAKASGAKRAAGAKAGARRDSSKRRFIEGLPADTPVVEVVALAKKAGIVLSGNYVYKLRRTGGGGASASRRAAKSKVAGLTGKWSGKSPKKLEDAFIDAALDLGLARAAELLDRVRAKLKNLAV